MKFPSYLNCDGKIVNEMDPSTAITMVWEAEKILKS